MSVEVSVVTPFHNDARYLADSIRSVLDQTFSDWELILVDDASSDSSGDIARAFLIQEPRVRCFRLSQNSGAAVARNLAIDKARGRFIAFLDADDIWHPEKLKCQLEFMDREEASLSCTSYDEIDEAGRPTTKEIRVPSLLTYRRMLTKNYIGCLTAMYDTHRTGKIHMPNLRRRQDYGLWLDIIRRSGPARGLDDVLAHYRRRESSISSRKLEMLGYNWRLMREVENFGRAASTWFVALQVLNRILK